MNASDNAKEISGAAVPGDRVQSASIEGGVGYDEGAGAGCIRLRLNISRKTPRAQMRRPPGTDAKVEAAAECSSSRAMLPEFPRRSREKSRSSAVE